MSSAIKILHDGTDYLLRVRSRTSQGVNELEGSFSSVIREIDDNFVLEQARPLNYLNS